MIHKMKTPGPWGGSGGGIETKASAQILHFPLNNRKPCCRAPWWIACECEEFFAIAERQRRRKIELRGTCR